MKCKDCGPTFEPVLSKPKKVKKPSQLQMELAFAKVQSKKGWKFPINKVFFKKEATPEFLHVLDYAVPHFTGGLVEMIPMSGGRVRVVAPGYYNSVGA